MEKNVLNTDLSGKVAVVTGASGTLCSIFAKALARAGAKVALLGRNMDKLKALADEIEAEGGVAKGYTCNVMNKANCLQVAEDVLADLGPCDILVNGAGGNNSRANTDKEYFEMGDLDTDTVTFFDLDESGVEMVFNLNFIGTLLPTQAFARQMVGRPGCNIMNISSMNAYLPLTKIPAYSGSKAAVTNFTQWLAVHFSKVGIRVNAIAQVVGQHQRRGISTRLQHQSAGGLDLHLAQQLGHGPACIGRGDQQQLHPESGGHPLQDAPVSGRKVPAQRQRDAGILVACNMSFHRNTSFQG